MLSNTTQTYKIGDSYQLIKELQSDSIDLIVTDPPYGYSFMGLDWDKAIPKIEIWQECLRVLKPGAFAFIMSAPRQDVLSQMIVKIGQAGFKTDFTSIYWTYASGFPKATNMGKSIDKKLGMERENIGQKLLNPRDKKVYTPNVYKGIQGTSTFEKNASMNMITIPSSPEAKALEGSYGGYQPKPAVEIIIVAMKPITQKTYMEQALKNGKGITWFDNCRIPYENSKDYENLVNNYKGGIERSTPDCKENWNLHEGGWKLGEDIEIPNETKGRFPANLIVSDDILNDGNIRTSCKSSKIHDEYGNKFKFGGGVSSPNNQYSDSGSYSRYFDLDKWFEEQVKKLPQSVQDTFPFLIISKASKGEKNKGCENIDVEVYNDASRLDKDAIGCNNPRNRSGTAKTQNHHPTVKPLKLFAYLVMLGSQKNDIILDPFCGSGTLLQSCKLLERNGIGFELNPEYELIIKGRCSVNMEYKEITSKGKVGTFSDKEIKIIIKENIPQKSKSLFD